MSCFVVSDRHLSAIIRWAHNLDSSVHRFGVPIYRRGMELEVFRTLREANLKSFFARYGGADDGEGGVFHLSAPSLRPIDAMKALDCLEYQCENWDGFEGSDAMLFIEQVCKSTIYRLPGYDAARWSIE